MTKSSRQISIAQLLGIVLAISVPLACFVNYSQKVTGSSNWIVTPMLNASGFALLWLTAGVAAIAIVFAVILYRRQWRIAAIYGLLCLTTVAFFGPRLFNGDQSFAPLARRNTDAMRTVIAATNQFVTTNGGQWPESWDDLRPLIKPSEFETIRTTIDFDFNADTAVLAQQQWHDFSAITPQRPFFNRYRDDLEELIGLLGN